MRSQGFVAVLTNVLVVAMVATGSAEDRRTVSVSGHGEIQVEPDIARVEMGIFVFDADLLKAKKETDAKIAGLLGVFKLLAVKPEDIQTTQVYVKPKYKEVEDKWQFIGYEVTRSVTVTLRDMARLNDLLDKAIAAGANRLEDVALLSSKEQEIKEQTLTEAIQDAKKQAATLASGFGAKVGKVISIEAGREGYAVSYDMGAPAFGAGTFQPGRIKIKSEVSVLFELAD